MPTTYIDLCNQVLRRLNDRDRTSDFGNVRVQALVKDAVKASVAKINQQEYEWPFNAASHDNVGRRAERIYSQTFTNLLI